MMPNSCTFSFWLTLPFIRKTHKYLNTGQGFSVRTSKLSTPSLHVGGCLQIWGLRSWTFPSLRQRAQCPGAHNASAAHRTTLFRCCRSFRSSRNVPEQTICTTCVTGILPTRSDHQISFCHICRCIGSGYKTQHLGVWPSVKTVSKAPFWRTVTLKLR